MRSPDDIAKARPAEVSGVAGSVAILLAHAFGVNDPTTLAALGVVVGAIPAGVTWLVVLLRSRYG